jgi:hypothetical protein
LTGKSNGIQPSLLSNVKLFALEQATFRNPSSSPAETSFRTVTAIAVPDGFDGEVGGAAHQVKVFEDLGHVVDVKPGEVEQLRDVHESFDEC